MNRFHPLHAPEREGEGLKGGGHPADVRVSEEDEIAEMTGETVGGHGKVPGIADPGVAGSKTNPVDPEKNPQPAKSDPPSYSGSEPKKGNPPDEVG